MRRNITLKPNEKYPFDIGRTSLILIIRDATRNVIFYGDAISEIELSRSDIVAVATYQQQRVFLRNDNDVDITVEFQLSDVPISIREQRMALEGGVVVEEITTPIQVSEIQAPVKISGSVPVLLDQVAVSNFPKVQRVIVENQSESGEIQFVKLQPSNSLQATRQLISANASKMIIGQNKSRKSVFIQPREHDIWLGVDANVSTGNSLHVVAGGSLVLETTAEIWVHSQNECEIAIVEEIY